MQVTTVGIDLAKNVFWVHGSDANGKAVVRKQLSRRQTAEVRREPAAVHGGDGGLRGRALLDARD